MKRTELLQEIRKMRFEEAYGGWQSGRLTQEEAGCWGCVIGRLSATSPALKKLVWTGWWIGAWRRWMR
jgi:hypothetical protein